MIVPHPPTMKRKLNFQTANIKVKLRAKSQKTVMKVERKKITYTTI